jgi:phospholipid/cholesterol/gamma-HCH transport system substrate-binding protein
MNEQTKNLLIGIFVIAACALIVSFIFFLKPTVGDGKKTYFVRFANINKISVGTRVTYAGKPVGEVTEIRQIFDAREQPTDSIGRLYFYELVLKVDSSVEIYNTDEISLQTSGLLGEKSVAIIPKPAAKGQVAKLLTNQPIYAESVDPLENAMYRVSELSETMEGTFRHITEWIDQHGQTMGDAIASFGSTMDEAHKAVETINNEMLIEEFKKAATEFTGVAQRANTALDEMHQGMAFTNISDVISNIKGITEGINNGEGTVGRLIKEDDLYKRIDTIMQKINILMTDLNNYGLLYHLNKSWQRLQNEKEEAKQPSQ